MCLGGHWGHRAARPLLWLQGAAREEEGGGEGLSCPLSPILPAVTLLLLCPALGRAFPPRDSEATASCFRPVPQAPAQACVVNGLLEGAREALGPVSRAQGEEAVEGQGRVAGTGGRLDGYGGLPI